MPEAKYVQLASIEKEGKQTESVIGIQSEYCPMTDAIRKHPIDSVKRQYNSTCNFSWGDISSLMCHQQISMRFGRPHITGKKSSIAGSKVRPNK